MRKINTALLSALLIGWLFGGSWWYSNNYGSVKPTLNKAFNLSSDKLQLSAKDNFYFTKSSSEISVPQTTRLAFLELAEYLNEHPSQYLKLTGLYSPTEVNDSKLKNLGLARAEALRKVLIDQGSPKLQINTQALKVDNNNIQNNHILGGVHFSFYTDAAIVEEAKDVLEKEETVHDGDVIEIESLNLYFTKSKYKLIMTPELDTYFDKLKKYLQYSPNAKINIIGHTDNQGKRKNNLRLSKYRAKKVRNFMLRHGFPKENLKINYKGPDEPIADNTTKEGRKKNRRVELRIIE